MKRSDAEILTVDDLAELFGCDKETAAARLTSGDLPGVKVGRGWIVPRQALFERLNEKAREEAASRRAHQAAILETARIRGIPSHHTTARLPTALTAALPQQQTLQRRGRKRRDPPELPKLAL